MRTNLRIAANGFVAIIFTLACAAITTQAQAADRTRTRADRSQYVISARAGGINLVSGEAEVRRCGASRWQPLTSRDELASGDTVRTGASGRVEMLLVPGSYLRVAEDSQFELIDSSLESLRVKLARGSLVVEATGTNDKRGLVELATPHGAVRVERRGLYRVNVSPGDTEVFVRKGEALVAGDTGGATDAVKVKNGRMLALGGGVQPGVVKFDKKDKDAFDLWSEGRAETLATANRRLSNRTLASAYSLYRRSPYGFGSGFRSSAGLWLYDPLFGGHTFLPFYYGLSSPYGYGYRHGFGFGSHLHNGFGGGLIVGGGHRHRSVHGSDHASRGAHSGSAHHRSPGHVSSGHHRRGH